MTPTTNQLNELELTYKEEILSANNFGSNSSEPVKVKTYSTKSVNEIATDMGLSYNDACQLAWDTMRGRM